MNHPHIARLKAFADAGIRAFLDRWPADEADGLYAPVHYLMALGGKRLRPVLGLAAAEAEGGQAVAALRLRFPRFRNGHLWRYVWRPVAFPWDPLCPLQQFA